MVVGLVEEVPVVLLVIDREVELGLGVAMVDVGLELEADDVFVVEVADDEVLELVVFVLDALDVVILDVKLLDSAVLELVVFVVIVFDVV